jgi:methionine sulfoxide reductase heme-binding subunit
VTFAIVSSSAYWYLVRGTGVVALLLLTASVVIGILGSLRWASAPRWPRFAIDTLHRDISLLVIVLLVVHIVTSVLDSFAPIRLIDAVIPFVSKYRPLWLGLGALAFDILVALVLTSLVRRRLGYRTWRAVHWLAYASWPIAVLHGLGTGSDANAWWMLAITAACVGAVTWATLVRIARARSERDGAAGYALALTIATPVALAIFTLWGPLQTGWARRAGTPTNLLAKPASATLAATPVGRSGGTPAAQTLKPPWDARLSGTVTQTQEPGGAIVDLALELSGGAHGKLRVRLAGAPDSTGGLSMTGSQVDLLADGMPTVMQGQVVNLQGQELVARVSGAAGTALDLRANLNIDNNTGSVSGTLAASPVGNGG